ncbi:MAG: FAD-dependent oxidoreductase [Bdellovibrionales bacterium]
MSQAIEQRDVLIVGAGIAGLSLAIRLKESGLNPLLIEKQVGVRNQLKGEFFQPKGVELLSELNLLSSFSAEHIQEIHQIHHNYAHPILKHTLSFSTHFDSYRPNVYGLICLHEDILLSLRKRYQSLGGDLHEGCHVVDLDVLQNATLCTLSSGKIIKTKIFVGSDGRYSTTRKMAQMPVVDVDCDRVMVATLMPDVNISEGVFYTEEIPQGVIYAFKYKNNLSRVYICFLKEELAKATAQREAFFTEKIKDTKLFAQKKIVYQEPILFMPTVDTMLAKRSRKNAVWIGDAAGVVDPLAGYGLTLSLQDAQELAETIITNLADTKNLETHLAHFAASSQKRYLHARYIGLWVATLFMGSHRAGRLAKWRTLSQVRKNAELQTRLLGLFSGFDTNPFHLHDIPYYLGLLPNMIHEKVDGFSIMQKMSLVQNYILTTPFEVKKTEVKNKFIELITRV